MYHIKKDLRMQKSAELFYEGLLSLLQDKPLDHITVTDLARSTGAGRTTFYRLFDDVIDILRWKCDTQFNEVILGFMESGVKDQNDLLGHVLDYWMTQSEVIEVLFRSGRQDIAYRSFIDSSSIVIEAIRKRGFVVNNDEALFFLSVHAGCFVGLMDAWLRSGKRYRSEQIITLANKLQFQDGFELPLIL